MYDQAIDSHFDLQNVSKDDLLEIIGDNSYILSYIIDNWNAFDGATVNPFTDQEVKQTLKKLGVQRHLLSKKPILERDSSDYKTYQILLKKADKPYHRFGIVSKEIANENIGVFADQIELYNSEAEARKALFTLEIEQNGQSKNLKVVAI